ncbi:hypothetical protein [Actinoplanes solisilvae]|uniref:hypothetical protein n=1 Tax=Actinoplanes solisilvae TaxID=2486853 RepID=UPI000FD83633|nr:hypothetical protein [Actinoplanes solisilvae]
MIPGYPDEADLAAPTVDGWPLAERPGFWAAHWQEHFIGDDPGLLPRVWGVDEDVLPQRLDELYATPEWPVFRVALRDGAELAVVFRNFADDAGADYLVLPAGGRDAIGIASLEGHQTGPGLSWAELVAVAARQADRKRRAQTLLLLAPAFGDDSAGTPDAAAVLADAMRELGAVKDVEELAARAVSDEVDFWGHVPWVAGAPDLNLAPRNPDSPVALPPDQRHLVAELLAP